MPKMNVRKGDKVEVITGKDKGKQGEVLRAMPKDSKVIVDGAAIVKRHTKPNAMNQQGGIIEKPPSTSPTSCSFAPSAASVRALATMSMTMAAGFASARSAARSSKPLR